MSESYSNLTSNFNYEVEEGLRHKTLNFFCFIWGSERSYVFVRFMPALLTLATSVRDISKQGLVALKVVSAIQTVIFQLPYRKAQKAMTRGILNSHEIKTDFNSKVLNLNMGMFYKD